jgi:hypothetical protein
LLPHPQGDFLCAHFSPDLRNIRAILGIVGPQVDDSIFPRDFTANCSIIKAACFHERGAIFRVETFHGDAVPQSTPWQAASQRYGLVNGLGFVIRDSLIANASIRHS